MASWRVVQSGQRGRQRLSQAGKLLGHPSELPCASTSGGEADQSVSHQRDHHSHSRSTKLSTPLPPPHPTWKPGHRVRKTTIHGLKSRLMMLMLCWLNDLGVRVRGMMKLRWRKLEKGMREDRHCRNWQRRSRALWVEREIWKVLPSQSESNVMDDRRGRANK